MDDNEGLAGQNGYDAIWLFETEAEERAYCASLYGDIVGVGQSGIQHRLRGARLAAGFVYASAAARLLDLTESTYRHSENGWRPVTETIAKMAAELYGVDLQFLLEGVVKTEREALAERLAAIVEREKPEDDLENEELDDLFIGLMTRLREMRIAEGHRTPSAAAKVHGWNRSTYWQHEAGTNGISMDRMIAYSLAMGARPEWAVLGEGSRQELSDVDWQEQPRDASPSTSSRLPMR